MEATEPARATTQTLPLQSRLGSTSRFLVHGKIQKRLRQVWDHDPENRTGDPGNSARQGFDLWWSGARRRLSRSGAYGSPCFAPRLWIALAAGSRRWRSHQVDGRLGHRTAIAAGSRGRPVSRAKSGHEEA